METPGPVLSTVKIELGPADRAVFPRESTAVFEAIDILRVPSPVMPETVTIRVVDPVPDTETVPFAVPVLFRVMCDELRVIELAPS